MGLNMYEEVVSKMVKLFEKGDLVFFVGAGISNDPPSSLPLFGGLTERVIKALCGDELKDELESILSVLSTKPVRPEVLFQIMVEEEIGDNALEPLNILKSDKPNQNHFFLARAIVDYGNFVITTNQDSLIEEACKRLKREFKSVYFDENGFERWWNNKEKGCIFKFHGTLEDIDGKDRGDTIKVALSQVGTGLIGYKRKVLEHLIKNYDMFFIGYSEQDDFDINPVILSTESEKIKFRIKHTKNPCYIGIKNSELVFNTENFIKDMWNELNFGVSVDFSEWAKDISTYHKILIIGRVFEHIDEWDDAKRYYEKCLEISEKRNDDASIAHSKRHIGDVLYKQTAEKWDEAIDKYKGSLKIFEELKDVKNIARLNSELGLVYYRKGNLDKAKEYLKGVINVTEGIDEKEVKLILAQALNRCGLIYYQRGSESELEEAKGYCERSLNIKKDLGDVQGEHESLNALALIRYKQSKIKKEQSRKKQEQGEIDESAKLLKESIDLLDESIKKHEDNLEKREKVGDWRKCGQTCYNLVLAYTEKNDLDEAIRYCSECEEYYEKIKPEKPIRDIYAMYYRKGELFLMKKDFDNAIKWFDLFEKKMDGLKDWHWQANALNNLGKSYFDRNIENDRNESIKCYRMIVEIYDRITKDNKDILKERAYGCENAKQNLGDALKVLEEVSDISSKKALEVLNKVKGICM
jgi:tetratricopeptide (TPR) repeat protein